MTIYLTYKTSGIAQIITSNYIIKENLMKEERYFKDLAPSSNTLSCQISKDCPFIEDIISSEEDIECMLYQEGSTTPFFGGYVSNNFSWSVGKNGSSVLKLTIEDFGTRLLKKTCVDKDTLFNDTAQNFVSSLVSDKFSIDVSRLPNTNIVYTITKNSTYESVLKKLVQELGYVYYFDYTGTLRFKKVDINKDNYLYTIDKSTLYSEGNKAVSLSKKIRKYSKVEVEWKSLETKPNACIYRDITGSDSSHPNCNIELAAGATYPDPNGKPSYIQAANLDGSEEVVYFTSPQKDVSFVGNVTVDITQYDPNTLSVLVKNVGSSTAQVLKLSCYGDLTIVKAINYTVVGDDDGDCLKVKAEFIHDEDSAREYANLLLNYYKYCSNVYTFYSSEDINVGSVCILKEDVHTGLNVSVVVTEKLFNPQLDYYQYIGNGLSQFDVWESNTIGVVPPPKQEAIDGQSLYTWVKYADTPTSGMSDDPDGKSYIGLAYNKSSSNASTSYSDYTWSKIKGTDGTTLYTWVKYADTPTSGMSNSPTGKAYIGLAYNKTSSTASTTYSDYAWSLIKGEDGTTTYTWIKYSNSSTGSNMSDNPSGMSYIGIAFNKTTATESTNPSDYQWSLFKGDNGITYYTWVKYADTPTSGMSTNPTGKAYIGLAYNKTTEEASTVYSDYSWSLIKGEDGNKNYTWIKYSNSSTGSNMSDSPSGMSYIGLAYNKTTATESTNPSDYQWMLFKGEPGTPAYVFEIRTSSPTYVRDLRETGTYNVISVEVIVQGYTGTPTVTVSNGTYSNGELSIPFTNQYNIVEIKATLGDKEVYAVVRAVDITEWNKYLGALSTAPSGTFLEGDFFVCTTDGTTYKAGVPYIRSDNRWVMMEATDPKLLDCLTTIIDNPDIVIPTNTPLYNWMQNLVVQNAVIGKLFAQYIKLGGAIYSGGYDYTGTNSQGTEGFYLSSTGKLKAVSAELKDASIVDAAVTGTFTGPYFRTVDSATSAGTINYQNTYGSLVDAAHLNNELRTAWSTDPYFSNFSYKGVTYTVVYGGYVAKGIEQCSFLRKGRSSDDNYVSTGLFFDVGTTGSDALFFPSGVDDSNFSNLINYRDLTRVPTYSINRADISSSFTFNGETFNIADYSYTDLANDSTFLGYMPDSVVDFTGTITIKGLNNTTYSYTSGKLLWKNNLLTIYNTTGSQLLAVRCVRTIQINISIPLGKNGIEVANIMPITHGVSDIGSEVKKFNNIWANKVYGAVYN